jgi:hypothetical protein
MLLSDYTTTASTTWSHPFYFKAPNLISREGSSHLHEILARREADNNITLFDYFNDQSNATETISNV